MNAVRTLAGLALAALLGVTAITHAADPGKAAIQAALDAAYAKYRTLQEGANADYIPALAKLDPQLFGIALVTSDGKIYTAGDVDSEVSIQSISKGRSQLVHGHRGGGVSRQRGIPGDR